MYLYKRDASPYWWTEFTVQGRRIRRSTEAASRRDAETIARRLRDEAVAAAKAAPKGRPVEVLTLDKACGRYWIEHGRRLKDARNEKRNLKYIVLVIGADLPLSDVSNRHVNALVKRRVEMGAGPAGVNRTISTLKTMLNRAAKLWEEPVRAISWSAHKMAEPRERVRYLTPDECRRLLDCLEPAPHIGRVVHFLLMTGLRRSEAFNATWDKLDEKHALLTVKVKGGHWREVPLTPDAMQLLRDTPREGLYIFDTTNWRKHFDAALKAADIEDFHWHDLRHTFATLLGKSGAPLEVVSKALGHSSVTVTMKYRHVLHDEVRAAMHQTPTLRPHIGNVIPLKKA